MSDTVENAKIDFMYVLNKELEFVKEINRLQHEFIKTIQTELLELKRKNKIMQELIDDGKGI